MQLMAYKITLSLGRLEEDCVRHALSPEDAAHNAWQLCEKHGLNMPNSSWKMKTWDTWEGQYETNPITDHMIRGSGGTYPKKTEFMHGVIDELTKNSNDSSAAFIMARAGVPHTAEPGGGSSSKFEIFRGKDKLLVEYDDNVEWSAVDDLGPKLDDVIDKAHKEDELGALAELLEGKLQDIKNKQKKRKMEPVD